MNQVLINMVRARKAVIFDLYHTLTAAESSWGGGRPMTSAMLGIDHAVWDKMLLEASRDRLVGRITDPYEIVGGLARRIDPSIPDDVVRAAVENRVAKMAAAVINIPEDVQQVLRAIKERGQKLGLISNADVIEAAGWRESPIRSLFDVAVFSCEAGWVKPEREIYEIALQRLGLAPGEVVFVGDGGSNELAGAREVGMSTVMMAGVMRRMWPERIEERKHQADFVIERLGELVG